MDQMVLARPSIVWRIAPFNTTKHCVTKSFKFLNCDWRWEYYVHAPINENDKMISVHLKRLTNSSASPLTRFSTIVSIRNLEGEHHAVRFVKHEISPVICCVWKKLKSSILAHDVIEHNGCTFCLTLEPLGRIEDLNASLNNENPNVLCLQELSKDLSRFLNCSSHADIILQCDSREIKAHKDVLCFRSKKFANMIQTNDNLEKVSKENLDRLVLENMDPLVFEVLIRYIYTATLPNLTSDLAWKIYKVADEYCIKLLMENCACFIIEDLSRYNAIETLLLANEHNDDNLKWAASSYIAGDLNLMDSDEYRKLAKDNPMLAIKVFKIFTERRNKGGASIKRS